MPPDTKIPNNAEIDQALKEFEMQSGGVPQATPQVVTPDTPQPSYASATTSDLPKMVRLVIKYSGGAIKDQRQAEYVLLALTILFFAVSLYLFFRGGPKRQEIPPEQLERMMQITPNQ